MAGPPSEPPLPRPIVRVLQRCLARSPFERFPDARALADALDAALRVAPVPGTRKDIGAQVTQTLERISAMNEGELSGMLALDIGTGPISKSPAPPPVPSLGRDSEAPLEMSTLEFVRPDAPVPGPTPLVGPSTMQSPASTVPEMQKPFTTVPGLAPPPIPVPQGIATPPPGSLPPAVPGTSTLLGIQNAKSPPAIPLGKLDFKKKPGAVPNIPSQRPATPPPLPQAVDDARRTGPRAERPSALMRAIDEADVVPPSSIGTALPPVEPVRTTDRASASSISRPPSRCPRCSPRTTARRCPSPLQKWSRSSSKRGKSTWSTSSLRRYRRSAPRCRRRMSRRTFPCHRLRVRWQRTR
jgi:hypothetical protein